MAKKKSRRRSAESRNNIEESVQEPQGSEKIIEYEPEAEYRQAELAVKPAPAEPGVLQPDEGLLKAKDELVARLRGKETLFAAATAAAPANQIGPENIQTVGIGLKETGGRFTGDLAVKVFVREKLATAGLAERPVVPSEISGYSTDVEVVGEFYAESDARRYPRPVPCGVSVGHCSITAGTFGCLVVLKINPMSVLSNNYLLANVNDARSGDRIIQPGTSEWSKLAWR